MIILTSLLYYSKHFSTLEEIIMGVIHTEAPAPTQHSVTQIFSGIDVSYVGNRRELTLSTPYHPFDSMTPAEIQEFLRNQGVGEIQGFPIIPARRPYGSIHGLILPRIEQVTERPKIGTLEEVMVDPWLCSLGPFFNSIGENTSDLFDVFPQMETFVLGRNLGAFQSLPQVPHLQIVGIVPSEWQSDTESNGHHINGVPYNHLLPITDQIRTSTLVKPITIITSHGIVWHPFSESLETILQSERFYSLVKMLDGQLKIQLTVLREQNPQWGALWSVSQGRNDDFGLLTFGFGIKNGNNGLMEARGYRFRDTSPIVFNANEAGLYIDNLKKLKSVLND